MCGEWIIGKQEWKNSWIRQFSCYSYPGNSDNGLTYGGDCGNRETHNIEKMFWK